MAQLLPGQKDLCEREENERAEHEVRGVENRAFKKKMKTGQRGNRKDSVSWRAAKNKTSKQAGCADRGEESYYQI